MATCKDCIHYDMCGKKPHEDTPFSAEQYCPDNFKDKELIVELPCKVGDKIYQLDTAGNIYESEITKIIYDTNGIAFDERAIGKGVFLSREAAEQALKAKEIIKN